MSSSEVELRTGIRTTDREAIETIVRAAGNFKTHEIAVALEVTDDRLTRADRSDYRFALAEIDGEVAGFVCFGHIPCTSGSYDIYWLVVHPRWQRCGIGTLLLAEAEVACQSGRRVYIETSSRVDYASARSFYVASGYSLIATLPDFYAQGDAKMIYVKALDDGSRDRPPRRRPSE